MIRNRQIKTLFLFISIIVFSSCFSEKKIAYFQKDNPSDPDTLRVSNAYIPTIEPGDILSIYVSSLSPLASSFFNPFNPVAGAASGTASDQSSATTQGATTSPALSQTSSPGFLVDPNGNIELPLLGKLSVIHKTSVQAQDTIKGLLKTYLKEPTVTVRVLNYKISILGEVNKPSVYVIPNEMITLPEALSMAGDLTIFAKRENIQIIREVNGKKEFGYVNLNNRDVFKSPYYYLHANDLIYVQPAKSKAQSTDRTYIFIPSLVSLVTAIIILAKK